MIMLAQKNFKTLGIVAGLLAGTVATMGCNGPSDKYVQLDTIEMHATIIDSSKSPNADPAFNDLGDFHFVYEAPAYKLTYDNLADTTNARPGTGVKLDHGTAIVRFPIPALPVDANGFQEYLTGADIIPDLVNFQGGDILVDAQPGTKADPAKVIGTTLIVDVIFDINSPSQPSPEWQYAKLMLKRGLKKMNPFSTKGATAIEELRDVPSKPGQEPTRQQQLREGSKSSAS